MSEEYAKYHYFGDRSKSRTRVITFATKLNKDTSVISFSFSCSNKKDIYDKKLGRSIALNRLFDSKWVYTFNLNNENIQCKYHNINNYLIEFIRENPELFPSWAYEII